MAKTIFIAQCFLFECLDGGEPAKIDDFVHAVGCLFPLQTALDAPSFEWPQRHPNTPRNRKEKPCQKCLIGNINDFSWESNVWLNNFPRRKSETLEK